MTNVAIWQRTWSIPEALLRTVGARRTLNEYSADNHDYPLLRASAVVRPLGSWLFQDPVEGVMTARLRTYSDDKPRVGRRLELETTVDGQPLVVHGTVAWMRKLPRGAEARYELGIHLAGLTEAELARLQRLFESL